MDHAFETAKSLLKFLHIDDSGARHQGQNFNVTVLCNPLCTVFKTTPNKNRLTVIENLMGSTKLKFPIDDVAIEYLKTYQYLGHADIKSVETLKGREFESEEDLALLAQTILPNPSEKKIYWVVLSAAYAYFKKHGVVTSLMADAAAQFATLVETFCLCWVHELRHYKTLSPITPIFEEEVINFKTKVKQFYQTLKAFKQAPSEVRAAEIEREFDKLFSTKTNYEVLNATINQTRKRREGLLMVLKYPNLPLENNAAEREIRPMVLKRGLLLFEWVIFDEFRCFSA
jgi:hypothetical protein